MEVYNKNRDKNNSLSDEIREQNAKLKGASLKDKVFYFKDYYLLPTLGILAICAFVFSLGYSILTAPRDTALGVFFYNDTGDSSDTRLIDGFVESMGIDTSKQNAYIDSSMTYDPHITGLDAYVGLEKAMASITASDLDVIVGDTDTVDYFAKCDCLGDVTAILPADLQEAFQDRLYYAETGSGESAAVGIYVSDAPKLNEFSYYVDREPVFSFVVNSDKAENAVEFLRYLYQKD